MSINKLALIRYKTIDECLQNRFRKWTLENLIDCVSDALYEYEGIDSGVSKRTIQADIQLMRSDKLGYNAPIVVLERKYYAYEDSEYSITKTPMNASDLEKMKEIVGVLKQFNGFNYFDEMSEMITKLEHKVQKSLPQSRDCIQFESNRLLRGIGFINPLYQAILKEQSLMIEYQSFKATESKQGIYYPYLLKEYRNRWFLIAKSKSGRMLLTLALDRIVTFEVANHEVFKPYEGINFERYFSDLIGVTKSERDRACKVIIQVDKMHAPYVRTKPLHNSQIVEQEMEDGGIIIRIDVVLNFELEREILGFGEGMKVLEPRILSKHIEKRLQKAAARYVGLPI